MQMTPSSAVIETPYPRGCGSFASSCFHCPSGAASTNTRSCQTLDLPRHGGPSGKFAPPATISAPFDTPANDPAKPIGSGSGGSVRHASGAGLGVVLGAVLGA